VAGEYCNAIANGLFKTAAEVQDVEQLALRHAFFPHNFLPCLIRPSAPLVSPVSVPKAVMLPLGHFNTCRFVGSRPMPAILMALRAVYLESPKVLHRLSPEFMHATGLSEFIHGCAAGFRRVRKIDPSHWKRIFAQVDDIECQSCQVLLKYGSVIVTCNECEVLLHRQNSPLFFCDEECALRFHEPLRICSPFLQKDVPLLTAEYVNYVNFMTSLNKGWVRVDNPPKIPPRMLTCCTCQNI
jgi:hypothetical protein